MHGLDENLQLEIGPLLRQLRGRLSLRDVNRLAGVSSSYLSSIERGERRPGRNVIQKLAAAYGVDPAPLLERAGHVGAEPVEEEDPNVERAYQYVLSDPKFRFGTRPEGPLSTSAKKFIVEMYESLTGRRLL